MGLLREKRGGGVLFHASSSMLAIYSHIVVLVDRRERRWEGKGVHSVGQYMPSSTSFIASAAAGLKVTAATSPLPTLSSFPPSSPSAAVSLAVRHAPHRVISRMSPSPLPPSLHTPPCRLPPSAAVSLAVRHAPRRVISLMSAAMASRVSATSSTTPTSSSEQVCGWILCFHT